jgi:error-prone DNA polymerase
VGFVELAARSSFSFLRGASHPEEMIDRAKAIGLDSIAICDRDGIYGAARAHARAREVEQNFHVGAEIPLALAEDELRAGYAGMVGGPLNEAQCRQLLPGAKPNALRRRMLLEDGYPSLILLVKNRQGYQNLCWLLTRAHADMPKGECLLDPSDLTGHVDGLIALIPTQLIRACLDLTQLTRLPLQRAEAEQIQSIHAEASPVLEMAEPLASVPSEWAVPSRQNAGREVQRDAFSERMLARLCGLFGAGTGIYSVTHRRLNRDDVVRAAVANARQQRHGLPVLASARPVYHDKERQRLSDVMQCIRLGTTLSQAKTRIASNAQAYLRSAAQMRRLFRDQPEWIERTGEVASELQFKLGELHYYFPCQTPAGETPDEYLKQLSWKGAHWRYPGGIPEKVKHQIDNELRLIRRMEVAPYFLSTWEVVEMARSRGILCQGRGSAANSAVCYVLGITAVNPDCSNLLFERFMSEERKEPPDIDVDFEHERREEVIQEIYSRYGRERAAMVSEVICYRRKSALRDVSKVFGLSLDQCDRLVRVFSHWDDFSKDDAGSGDSASLRQRLKEAGLDDNASKVRGVLLMAQELSGFPRHLSIHVEGSCCPRAHCLKCRPSNRRAWKIARLSRGTRMTWTSWVFSRSTCWPWGC